MKSSSDATAETIPSPATDSGCIPEHELMAIAEGKLPAHRTDAVIGHVDRCTACARVIAELGAFEDPRRRIDRYRIDRMLGAGGMGIVYAAFDPQLERRVAIKLVHPEKPDPTYQQLMLHEAKMLAKVDHPNIVGVYDVGEHEGEVFVATELVDGTNLWDWQVGRSTESIVGAWLQAIKGLAAAHEAGIVHRDVKPQNVFVGRDGRVRVGDFGIARNAPIAPKGVSGNVLASTIAGTPAYMAPEQAEGIVDARSDQYAVCVAIAEALTGKRPDANATVVTQPPQLATVLTRGLRTNPDERYPNITALGEALAAAIAPATPPKPKPRWPLFVAAGGAVGATVIAIVVMNRHDTEKTTKTETQPAAAPAQQEAPAIVTPAVPDKGLDLSHCTIGAALPADTTVLAVGAYNGHPLDFTIDRSGDHAGRVDVDVTTPGNVALLFGGYEPIIWNVRWQAGTKIVGVLAAGYHRQAVAGLPRGTPIVSSAFTDEGLCNNFDGPEQESLARDIAKAAFGKDVAKFAWLEEDAEDMHVVLGSKPRGKLQSSKDIDVEHYRDPAARKIGPDAFQAAIQRKVLRAATAADVKEMTDLMRSKQCTTEIELLGMTPTFVVTGPYEYPDGLFGADMAAFYIPHGVPAPIGNPGHSVVVDVDRFKCD